MTFVYKNKSDHKCGQCVHYPICSKFNVKNAQEDTEYCLWEKDYFIQLDSLVSKISN